MQNTGMQGSTPSGSTTEKLAEQASATLSRLSDTAHQTMGRVSSFASQLSERGGELMQGRTMEQVRVYVRQHPVAAIGIAIAIGLILSKLTSRR